MMMSDEEKIIRKALSSTTKGCTRKIPFTSTEQLIDDLETLYPAVNEIFIYNVNQRDTEGSPTLTVRNVRGLRATLWLSQTYNRLDAKWQFCFVAVEDRTAYVKVAQVNVGEA